MEDLKNTLVGQKVKVKFDFPFNNEVYKIIDENEKQYQITGKTFIVKDGEKTSEWIDKSMVKNVLILYNS